MGAGMEGDFVSVFILKKSGTDRLDVNFQPVFPAGSNIRKIRVNGLPARDWGTRVTDQGQVYAEFGFWLDSTATVEILWNGGITALPVVCHPKPDDPSQELRIVNTCYSDTTYTISCEGITGKTYELKVWAAIPGKVKAEGAEIKSIKGNIITLQIDFPLAEGKTTVKEISLN